MIENKRKKEKAEKMLNIIFETSLKCQKLLESCPELEGLEMKDFRVIRRLSLNKIEEITEGD